MSEAGRLRQSIQTDRRRVADGERPRYHAVCRLAPEGVDITVRELPIVHLFAPDDERLQDAARLLIARTLGVDPDAFDLRVTRTAN